MKLPKPSGRSPPDGRGNVKWLTTLVEGQGIILRTWVRPPSSPLQRAQAATAARLTRKGLETKVFRSFFTKRTQIWAKIIPKVGIRPKRRYAAEGCDTDESFEDHGSR